ncbi:Phosphoenolpyruvate/pyruvate domain-containing protein [Aspergillus niger CBS 101883]|uniref:Phosphoenolpyruvate/pyruvate domain-containing protein n=1 Tax=Aspergillus niger ATCC 13496 TaxID=1353008 RepID=A0A370C796_ASPNG|nr:Phosphoenolpyruvate/pyruvate domain-containing protein [Aspergillus niger CBS 101883]PYH53350.1 Phosphoenolpyruvate/pyruvate domain-containing protein [Aspergillus niger CBS 101883]RDH22050.1 Phosphoenolpyruvate/pyruvate domain-containing protein [Aspergillus niger ATCC 13496]
MASTAKDGSGRFGDMRDYMAKTLFQPHRARDAIWDAHQGKIPTLLRYYAGLASVPITRWLAPMGFDYVWIDWEHSAMNIETMTTPAQRHSLFVPCFCNFIGSLSAECIHAQMVNEAVFLSNGRTIPWVRVPGHDHATMAYALDAGASIVVPQVDKVEQAKEARGAVKFGRKNGGHRSAPPFRYVPGLTDVPLDKDHPLWEIFNRQLGFMIQVESLEEVPEIDAVWLGTIDARVSMGLPGGHGIVGTESEWLEAVELFHKTMRKHDKPYSGFCLAKGDAFLKKKSYMSMCIVAGDTLKLSEMMGHLAERRAEIAQTQNDSK